jgi:hypothetical protein
MACSTTASWLVTLLLVGHTAGQLAVLLFTLG